MSALTDLFTAMANKIRSKTGTATTYTPPQMVSSGIDDVYNAGVAAGTTPTQTKTVTAGTSATTVTPDSGYALSSVTVNPTPTETGSATPTTSAQTITPSSGKYLSSVSVGAIQIDSTNNTATPTTSAQTITPASGKYFSSFGVGAIPSEYIVPSGNKSITGNGTGIDVKAYATASVSVSGTSITPSNSSPASMTSGTLYTPSANGVAISSYSSVTPSNASPVTLSSGSIYKMSGAGKAVASVTNITPSDSSPVAMTSGTVYKAGGAGYAYATQQTSTSITPSDSSPVAMSANTKYTPSESGYAIKNSPTSLTPSNTSPPSIASGTIYKGGGSGYAISSYSSSSITPSASGAYFSSGWNRMTSSGYACTSQPSVVKIGSATISTSTTTTINLGFTPKYICARQTNASEGKYATSIYDTRFGSSKIQYAGTSVNLSESSLPNTSNARINSVSSTGFVYGKASSSSYTVLEYFAIG